MSGGPAVKGRIGGTTVVLAIALLALVGLGVVAFARFVHPSDNPGCETSQRSSACTRVLFLGNSYTSVNDLPTMFANLAWAGGHRVETGMQAPGGWTLADHAGSRDTVNTMASKQWDFVVLQEQSEIPSVESYRQAQMYPAARRLVSMIRDAGATPMLFVTWAHQGGWPQNRMPDYVSMQSSIDEGYLFIAGEQHAAVAPVGFAWMTRVGQSLNPDLWQGDGSHPTTAGTYLAASVFYAAIFIQSPTGLSYHADLADDAAASLQEVASSTVLGDLSKWRLP
jgi:hypothetical protein